MKIHDRNLIVVLLAVLSSMPIALSASAIGQDASTVNIRPTVPPTSRGLLAADVTVSKKRVRVGEWVTVTMVAPPGVSRPLFSVSFGDGNKQETTNTQINHKYGKIGHYDVYAWVTPQKDSPRRDTPSVSLSADPKLVLVKRPVKFNARIDPDYPDIKFRFVFGDREQTGWQDQSQTVHAYDLANTYLAHVDIGGLDNGAFNLLGRSARQSIQVNFPQPSVELIAEPTRVEVGSPVKFTAVAVPRDPNINYRFVFGDGTPPTAWQNSSQATHQYASANTYSAYVEISTARAALSGANIRSGRKPIQVIPPQSIFVELFVKPTKIETEKPVTLIARADSRDPNIRYRFFYGDGSSSDWQTLPLSRHKYSAADNYFPYVEAGFVNNNQGGKVVATSKPKQVAVTSPTPTPTPTPKPTPTQTPTPTPAGSPTPSPNASPGASPNPSPSGSPTASPGASPNPSASGSQTLSPESSPLPPGPVWPWTFPWWYLLIALLVAGGGYWAFKALFVPPPTFRSRSDAGSSQVDQEGKPLAIESQILLKPNIAEGKYRVGTDEGNLIRSVKRENEE
jgi:hypothetical protein